MAKGFGAILAEVAMSMTASETILCPLCGERMEFTGVAYFCHANEDEHASWLYERREAAYEYRAKGNPVFYRDLSMPAGMLRRNEGWEPDMQTVILAVQESTGAKFMTVRGRAARTSFRVDKEADPKGEWTFADWVVNK